MAAVGAEMVLGLSWTEGGTAVRCVLLGADGHPDGPADEPEPFSGEGFNPGFLLADWDITYVLLPARVRRRLREQVARLRHGQVLRIRLRAQRDPGAPLPLSAFPWERARVPAWAVDRRPDEWDAWQEDPYERGASRLGEDSRFSLVREVAPVPGQAPGLAAARRTNKVVIANAAAVYGDITVGAEQRTVPQPPPGSVGDGDAQAVVSALEQTRFVARPVPSPASAEGIRQSLASGALALYFGGHHVGGGLVVAQQEGSPAAAWLAPEHVSAWLVRDRVPLAVLMSCDSARPVQPGDAPPERSLAERLAGDGVPFVVAVDGRVSDAQAREFAARFFPALVEGHPVDLALHMGAGAFSGTGSVPVLYTSDLSGALSLGILPPESRPALPSEAYRVPVTAAGYGAGDSGEDWPDVRFRLQLETRLCLAEGSFAEVLADPDAGELVELLNYTERLLPLRKTQGRPGHAVPRQWYVYQPGRYLPPFDEHQLHVNLPAYQPGKPAGLVVRRSADQPTDLPWAAYIDALRRFLPGLHGIVIQVHEGGEKQVRWAAQRIAERLGLEEYLLRPAIPAGPAAAGALSETLRQVFGERNRALPAGDFDAPEAVIGLLNREGAPWDDTRVESAVLQAVRARLPEAYPDLLKAHAALRSDPARWASLRLAAREDSATDDWLRAAAAVGRLPRPADFPGQLIPRSVVDAVVLGLLRTGKRDTTPAEFDAWLEEEPSAEVAKAAEVARLGPEGLEARHLDRPEVAVALDRTGLLSGDIDWTVLDPHGRHRGTWALLARRQLTDREVNWALGLSPGRRALLGLAADPPGSTDVVLQEQLHELRQAYRPPLPRTLPSGFSGCPEGEIALNG